MGLIRPLGVLFGMALLIPAAAWSAAPAAAAPTTCSASPTAPDIGDIDGDGRPDAVVTSIYGAAEFLEVHNTTAGTQSIDLEGSLGMDGITDVVVADVTGDGCADAVGSYYDEEQNNRVGSFILPGSATGLDFAAAKLFDSPGWQVAVLKSPRMIAVNNYRNVALFPLAADGTPGAPTYLGSFPTGSEATGEIESMVADGNKLVIGTQSRAVGGKRAAGVVTVWTFTGTGVAHNTLKLTQNSPGFATASEKGDFFGSSLAIRGNYLAIGVPSETLGTKKQTGLVHVVKLSSGVKPKVTKVYNLHQDSPGIPGRNESGDRWGSSVALAVGVGCTKLSLVAGAPTEGVGGVANAGAVTVAGIGRSCGDAWSPGKAPLGAVSSRRLGAQVVALADPTTGRDVVLAQASGAGTSQVFALTTVASGKWVAKEVPALGLAGSRGGSSLALPYHG